MVVLYENNILFKIGGRNWTRTSEPEGVDLQSTGIAAIPYDQIDYLHLLHRN